MNISHMPGNVGSSWHSQELEDSQKLQIIQYYYYKNLLVFMIDTWKQILNCRNSDVFNDIREIYEVLGQVILKKANEIIEPITDGINYDKNIFQIQDFE